MVVNNDTDSTPLLIILKGKKIHYNKNNTINPISSARGSSISRNAVRRQFGRKTPLGYIITWCEQENTVFVNSVFRVQPVQVHVVEYLRRRYYEEHGIVLTINIWCRQEQLKIPEQVHEVEYLWSTYYEKA